MKTILEPVCFDLIREARQLTATAVADIAGTFDAKAQVTQLLSGKMLRTRLASFLACRGFAPKNPVALPFICAATEIVHTASLCHDDVIDNSLIRRAHPTLWRTAGPSGAILIGDLLLCRAMKLILEAEDGCYVDALIAEVVEVSAAETEQELKYRGKILEEETCLRLARGKAGPLFAFIAGACADDDRTLSLALQESGYCIGTAYQLADDLLDVVGSERLSGKTLGTDLKRFKCTLSQTMPSERLLGHVRAQCEKALGCLSPWPGARDAVAQYLNLILKPLFERYFADFKDTYERATEQ